MTERYTIISSDCHAGGSHAQYREFLDPAYHDAFDAWREKYRNPFKDLGDDRRLRNWDDEMRNRQQEADGVVAEVIFPNTVPPFFPGFVLFARPPKPDQYELRHAGIQAHNRWMADFCDRYPERRAGVGQIFLNDVDDALADIRTCHELGLRGGILLPTVPPDVDWVAPLYDPVYEPIWALCEELGMPVNCHGGTGAPDYGKTPLSLLLYINEVGFYGQRPFVHLLLAGVFERHPSLRFVLTEQGCAWLPPLIERLDSVLERVRSAGAIGELRYDRSVVPARSATEYVRQNVWLGVSQPGPDDVAAARDVLGLDRFMWGSDYPHDEGTAPFTRENLRALFHDTDETTLRMLLAGTAAEVYGFDLDALAPLAAEHGPTVAEIAQPLGDLPADANEALRKAAGAA